MKLQLRYFREVLRKIIAVYWSTELLGIIPEAVRSLGESLPKHEPDRQYGRELAKPY